MRIRLRRYDANIKVCSGQAKKAGDLGDNEQLRLAAEDAEFTRAKERLTLKHRNTSKWARRALKRGINITDEGAPLPLPTKKSPTQQHCCLVHWTYDNKNDVLIPLPTTREA